MIDNSFIFGAYPQTLAALGRRARALRLIQKLQQQELALRAGVGVATLHRFEKTGQCSLENALRIASALGAGQGFERLFEIPKYASIDDVLAGQEDFAAKIKRVRKAK